MPVPTSKITEAKHKLIEAASLAGDAIALLRDADASRVVARGQRDEIRDAKHILEGVIGVLPQK